MCSDPTSRSNHQEPSVVDHLAARAHVVPMNMSGPNGPGGPPADASLFTFKVPGGEAAGAEARRALVAGDGDMSPTVREDVLLLLTELVTNAVRHSGTGPGKPVAVVVHQWPGGVRVEVADSGPGFTWAGRPSPAEETGGWGLLLVDRLADRWGVAPSASGARVWFEILGRDEPR